MVKSSSPSFDFFSLGKFNSDEIADVLVDVVVDAITFFFSILCFNKMKITSKEAILVYFKDTHDILVRGYCDTTVLNCAHFLHVKSCSKRALYIFTLT